MGGIVKSIGKAIKKLGKGIGRFLKKYKTTIILAAAVWAGLGAFGASASGASIWSPASVKAGISRIFLPSATQPAGWGKVAGLPAQDMSPGWEAAKSLGKSAAKSSNVMSAIGGWLKDMPDWGKYALTQSGMTILGSMLDTSAEEEMAAKYGGMGRKYGEDPGGPSVFEEHPEWAVQPPPSWPSAPTTTSQTSTPQQASLARAPATVGPPRSQQITAMRTTPLDVRPPGMIGGRRQGLLQSSPQRRYA
jgi:hypothetical protein